MLETIKYRLSVLVKYQLLAKCNQYGILDTNYNLTKNAGLTHCNSIIVVWPDSTQHYRWHEIQQWAIFSQYTDRPLWKHKEDISLILGMSGPC